MPSTEFVMPAPDSMAVALEDALDTVSVAARGPVLVGERMTLTAQVALTGSIAAQVFPVTANWEGLAPARFTIKRPVAMLPVLVTVKVTGALAVLTSTCP